jgi:hypothetical protein
MKALIQFKTTRRPVSGDIIGVRLQAAVPNLKARKMFGRDDGSFVITKKEIPSFRKPYLIAESMDYGDRADISEAEVERFKHRLMWEGFTEFEMLGKKDDEPSMLDDETKAKIDRALGLV